MIRIDDRLAAKIRDEAQALASAYASPDDVRWDDRGTEILAHAVGFIAGAAAAFDITPITLLALAGAMWAPEVP